MKVLLIKTLRNFILTFFTGLLFAGVFFSATLISPKPTLAACRYAGQCDDNSICRCREDLNPIACYYMVRYGDPESALVHSDEACGSAIIGGVEPPDAVAAINQQSGGDIGLIFFISRIINFANIIAGILVMINFVYSGFLYVTGAGNASNMSKINERMMWSVVGILMIVGSYTLAAIFGLVFYGDPTFVINPTLTGALN